ncbi:VC1465 family Xer recombination activation factor [Stenotrophomonas sp. NPDC077464]|uniref:VC1465 family Xer recombination activation factor n=1 Tax=unclassified Stenotrophomonas TaxID=196198 RepID=UPI0037D880BD
MDRARRFRQDRSQLRLTHRSCSKLLQVSVRTIQNWEAGRTRIPHASFKLLRMLSSGRYLGDQAWSNFHVCGAVLHTPEGHTFPAADLAWWSLAIRQAEAFRSIMREQRSEKPGTASEGSDVGRQAGMEPGALAGVATSLLTQVGSAASSLPGRTASSEAPQTPGRCNATQVGAEGTGKDTKERQAAAGVGPAKDVRPPLSRGGRGSHSLTHKSRPKSAITRPASSGGAA